jgi:hypothetical protein
LTAGTACGKKKLSYGIDAGTACGKEKLSYEWPGFVGMTKPGLFF